ncbi:ornithine decarboxylase [Nocardia sp. BSTN01]|uniref:aminotransferase class I/II-fold pyridoxal phosphate-dependent enzyme n=1 Tax=Nocardia sp. BSTN01 TaxID=2783665 RepID=UPI00188FDBEA|nr:ornithine decarboxylase [Nocardia sp. BSTN01]MBF4997439.1 ornithine decarboxylase [Nocardia sp. BSTN01]
MDHDRAPVLDALRDFRMRGFVPFSPPGHKQGRRVDSRVLDVLGPGAFAADVVALNGLDDRLLRYGVLREAQELMADAVGADESTFSTCGSSLSVKSAMLAVAGPHDTLLVPRNAHKSVVLGLILSGARPGWVRPRWDTRLRLSHPPGPEEFRAAFARDPEAVGALLVSPTDYGTCSDVRTVAEVCHERDVPLIVDAAWGAHLPFHDRLPQWAMTSGADVGVTSVHKMGMALQQSSVFHLRGDRVDSSLLRQRSDLLDTTSPTSLVYASIDGWRRQMMQHGHSLLEAGMELAGAVRRRCAEVEGLAVADDDFAGPGLAASVDPFKITIDVTGLGVDGYQVADWLYRQRHIAVAVADHRRIVAQFTCADDARTADTLLDGLTAVTVAAPEFPAAPRVEVPSPACLEPETAMRPRDAFFAPAEQVPIDAAAGRVAAEIISPYPPGAPDVVPGDLLSTAVLDYLRSGLAAGMRLPDATDPTLSTVRVVAKG